MTDKPAETGSGKPADEMKPAVGETVSGDAKSVTGSADSDPTVETPAAPEGVAGSAGAQAGEPPIPASEATGPRRVGPRGLIAALAVAVVLLIGAVGVAGYLFVQERNKAETLAAHDEARQAACSYAPVLAAYDAKNLDPYFAAVLAGATGDWKKEFETTTSELREALVAGQVVSTAGDIECAVKSADATSAEVVVVIGQTISSLGTQGQPAPGQLSMVMRMEKTDGRWLVNQMITPLAPAGSQ